MITAIIVVWAIGSYIAIALATYIFLSKFLPYNPDDDYFCDGDSNKGAAVFWPISIPILLVIVIVSIASLTLDKIRDDVTKHNNK